MFMTEPNQLGLDEGSYEDSREPANNNSNMEDDTSLNVSASAFGVTPGPAFSPSTLNHDALNVSQNNQRRDDLIKGNHPL